MANVNFSEKEYFAVANAAAHALQHGDRPGAVLLNELASKMNAGLTKARYPGVPGFAGVPVKKLNAPGPIDAELGIKRTPDISDRT